MRHWPLFHLTLTTPDLVLRLPDDRELDALAQAAAEGVHPPDVVCFPQPWTSGTPEEVARNVVQNHWWARGNWTVSNWRLLLAVFHDGKVIGQQNLSARHFSVTRETRTGFWLGERYQRSGYGTQMRQAAIHLAFGCLGAERVTATAFTDNIASRKVSAKLGYEPNGVHRQNVGGKLAQIHETVLDAWIWRTQTEPAIQIQGFEICAHMFGAGT